MIVKIKCKECKGILMLRRPSLKDARKTKRLFKNKYVCSECTFKVMANKTAKEIVSGVKQLC